MRPLPGRVYEDEQGGQGGGRVAALRLAGCRSARSCNLQPGGPAGARPAAAIGALAVGAAAIGGFAIGRLSVGRLAVGRAKVGRLEVEEVEIGRLSVRERTPTP